MIICDKLQSYHGPVMWVFELIKKSYGLDLLSEDALEINVGIDRNCDVVLSEQFYKDLIEKRIFSFDHYFEDKPLIFTEDGDPDYISTIFYLVNGFQEYDLQDIQKDKYNRLLYDQSLQSKFQIVEHNLVEEYIQALLFQIDTNLKIPKKKSRIFISHDIDSVYGSLKYDGLWALKNGRINEMIKVIAQTVFVNPPWFNIDKVANLENEYDVRACYYWIVQNGRSDDGIKNGDYNISNARIKSQVRKAIQHGNEIGLHKSTMPVSFQHEISRLTNAGSNRFHFLKINNPDSYKEMEEAGIKSDSSIGFPYKMGFKNSFGLPYFPYNIKEGKSYKVLEIPLQIMDGMFSIKDEQTSKEAYRQIIRFIENNAYNTVISILWHNSEMTNFAYKWSFKCYVRILKYISENSFETVLPADLVNEYQSV